jgi:hypothetical protein
MKIIVFGFTGLGNAVLRGILKSANVTVSAVFTKKYFNVYPYYDEVQMEDLCKSKGIKCLLDLDVNSQEVYNLIKHENPVL